MKKDARSEKSKKNAIRITTCCIIANLPVFAFLLFGPKEGMEELGIIVPWLITGAIHIVFVLPALLFALQSHQHSANVWIYSYFILFFGFHAIYLAHVNGMDTRLYQKFTAVWNPEQAEFHQLLSELRYIPSDDKTARVEGLILNGVDVNAMFPGDTQSALQKAGYIGNPRIIGLLLEKGAVVDGPPAASTTALGWAVQLDHTEAARLLLDSGADPNKGVSGYSFLNTAVRNQNSDMVASLLKAGADPNRRIYRPERPLMIAAMNGYKPIVGLLLEAGADPNYQLPDGRTSLVMAVQNGHPECVDALLNAGAELIGNGIDGTGLLALAATGEHPEITVRIQKAARSENTADGYGDTSFRNRYLDLYKALRDNRIDDFKKMIRIGISPDSTNDRGTTLLQGFCKKSLRPFNRLNVVDVAQILIENGADINRASTDGTTPLMHAARTEQTDLVKLLIRWGADINAVNKTGRNALYYAMAGERQTIEDVLRSAGAGQNK